MPRNDYIELENMTYITSPHSREMLINAYNAIQLTELWDYMKKDQDNYMFNQDKELKIISDKMYDLGYCGHSGGSFGWTMRHMQFIAMNGLEKHKELWISTTLNN
jgi:hypothetical protein